MEAPKSSLLLIHGGLWETEDAQRTWGASGIAAELRARGHALKIPERLRRARSWVAEADYLAAMLPATPMAVVAAADGCSVAVRLALQRPERVKRLVLCWPLTAGDSAADISVRTALAAAGADEPTIATLLAGGHLRGVSDAELKRLALDVGIVPALHDAPGHQRASVERLLKLVPRSLQLPPTPLPWQPELAAHLTDYISAIEQFAIVRR